MKYYKITEGNEWFRNDHNGLIGLVFTLDNNNAKWYNRKGDIWIDYMTPATILYWIEFGFSECTKEKASNILGYNIA